jgi:hypothetical protein
MSSTGTTLNINTVPGETIIDLDRVGIDEAFSKTNFTSITMQSSGNVGVTTTGSAIMTLTSAGNFTVDGAADGYFDFEGEMFLADARSAATGGPSGAFRLSTSATDFSASIRATAGVGAGQELGIIDAINALSATSSGIEKAIYVIASSDPRLTASNILSLNTTGGGPTRGSLELTPYADGYSAGNFYPGRDLQVWVNGQLMLADEFQKTNGTTPDDDYFLASNDLDKLNFSYPLVAGDIVIVQNFKPAPGENVSTNWQLVE